MEYQKLSSVLNDKPDLHSNFMIIKCIEINDQFNSTYTKSKIIDFTTNILISSLRDFNDLYIVVKETITSTTTNTVITKNRSPFINCITEINKSRVYQATELHSTVLMCILIE